MKKIFISSSVVLLTHCVLAQSVGIGSTQFTPSSTLEIRSTNNTAGTYGFKLLNSSSATMMYIQNDGNVGIGSATPNQKLSLVGSGNISGTLWGLSFNQDLIGMNNGDANWTFGGYNSGSNYWMQATYYENADNLRGFRILNRQAGDVVFSTNKTYSLFPFGNVGIGTSTPAALIHAKAITGGNDAKLIIQAGGEANEAHLVLSTGFSGNDYRKTGVVADGLNSWSRSDLHFVLNSDANTNNYTVGTDTKMIIKNDGNVGIGTTNPVTKLVVNNNTVGITPTTGAVVHVIGSDAGASTILLDGITNSAWFRGRLALGTAAVPASLVPGNYMATLAGRGYLGTTGYSAQDLGRVAIYAEEIFTNATAKTGILFETTATNSIASSVKMVLNGDGNLGIGTSLPSFILDLVSSTAGNNLIKLDVYTNTATNGAGIYARKARGTSSVPLTVSGGDELAKFLVQGYNGGFRSAGGIWNVVNTATLDGSVLPTDWVIGFDAQATSTPTKNITLKYSGNVGLGTANPGSKLHVFESNGANAVSAPIVMSRYWASATDTRAAAIFNYHNGTNTNDQLVFAVSGDGGSNNSPVSYTYAKMVIQANGNVGIGATEPIAKFVVNSGRTRLFANAEVFALGLGRTETGAAYFLGITNHATQPDLVFNNNGGQEKVRIQYDGRVGIGTTLPTAGLHVAGDGASIYAGFNYLQTARFKTNANGSIILDGGQTAGTSYLRGISWGFLSEDFGLTRFRIDQGVAPITDFYISTAGNVHVGGAAPGSKFDVGVNGDGTVARANAWNNFSDVRWKKDITPITNGLEIVKGLQGVNYTWKESNKKDFGFIAQEVEKFLPLAVHTDDKGYKSVDYARITSVLVEALKEQQKIIDELKTNNQKLKTENNQHENRLQKIEQQLLNKNRTNEHTQK